MEQTLSGFQEQVSSHMEPPSDVESQFEEERGQALPPVKKGGRWTLSKKLAIGFGLIAAIVLAIYLPIVLTRGSSDSSPASSTAMEVGTDGNAGAGAEPAVDVSTEDPIDSVPPPEDVNEPEETVTITPAPATPSPTPGPTASPTFPPQTLAPVTTQTACMDIDVANATFRNTTKWVQIADDIVGEAANDLSGRTMAMSADGSIIAVASAMNSGIGERAGHVRVYQFVNGEFTQLGEDLDGEAELDWFGTSVAMDARGLRMAVGARWNDGSGTDSGHVRLFDYSESSGSWEQVGDDLDGGAEGDQFGRSVALSGDGRRLAVGASNADGSVNVTDVGHVYLYEVVNDGKFSPIGKFEGDAENDFLGGTVVISEDGTHVAIAATLHDADNGFPDVGQVKIYKFDSDTRLWSKVGSSIEGKAPGVQAGLSVALSFDGGRVAVSFPQDIMGIPIPGIARVYELRGEVWVQIGENDLTGGHSLSMSRNGRVAVGDYFGFSAGLNSGYAHVYELNENSTRWEVVGQVVNGIPGEMSGTAVALSADGMRLAVSSPRVSPDGVEDIGAVRVYDLC